MRLLVIRKMKLAIISYVQVKKKGSGRTNGDYTERKYVQDLLSLSSPISHFSHSKRNCHAEALPKKLPRRTNDLLLVSPSLWWYKRHTFIFSSPLIQSLFTWFTLKYVLHFYMDYNGNIIMNTGEIPLDSTIALFLQRKKCRKKLVWSKLSFFSFPWSTPPDNLLI